MTETLNPSVVALGGLHLIVPNRGRRPSSSQWAGIRAALLFDAAGLTDAAQFVLNRVEAQMGVVPAHRLAVREGPEAVAQRQRDERRRARSIEHMRASRLNGAQREPAPTDEIERLIRQADAAEGKAQVLRSKNKKRNPNVAAQARQHDRVAKEARRLATSLRQAQIEQHFAAVARAEADDCARLRGEEPSLAQSIISARYLRNEEGALVRHRQDGFGFRKGDPVLIEESVTRLATSTGRSLEIAFGKGWLEGGHGSAKPANLYQTGVTYREAFEVMASDTSARRDESGAQAGFGPKGPQLRIVHAGDVLRIMRRGLTPKQRRVLDLVCGCDWRVGAVAKELVSGSPSVQRALRGGLATAMRNLTEAKKARREGEVEDVTATVLQGAAKVAKVRV